MNKQLNVLEALASRYEVAKISNDELIVVQQHKFDRFNSGLIFHIPQKLIKFKPGINQIYVKDPLRGTGIPDLSERIIGLKNAPLIPGELREKDFYLTSLEKASCLLFIIYDNLRRNSPNFMRNKTIYCRYNFSHYEIQSGQAKDYVVVPITRDDSGAIVLDRQQTEAYSNAIADFLLHSHR